MIDRSSINTYQRYVFSDGEEDDDGLEGDVDHYRLICPVCQCHNVFVDAPYFREAFKPGEGGFIYQPDPQSSEKQRHCQGSCGYILEVGRRYDFVDPRCTDLAELKPILDCMRELDAMRCKRTP